MVVGVADVDGGAEEVPGELEDEGALCVGLALDDGLVSGDVGCEDGDVEGPVIGPSNCHASNERCRNEVVVPRELS